MIHITEEGDRKKVGLNLYRTRGGFVVAWVWYYTATHELKGWRFRLRMHMKPRILWSVDSCNVIANYLTIHDLQLVNREVLVDLVASGNEGSMTQPEQEPVAWEQFYPDIGKPQLKQLPQLSQEVVLQYPKEAVALTDEQIGNLWDGHVVPMFGKNGINPIVFARAIEAAHGIKGKA